MVRKINKLNFIYISSYLQEGQEESEGNQIILGGFSNLLPSEVLYNLLADFFDHQIKQATSTQLQQYQMVTGVIIYTGYML
jgi:hypothetical protein